MDFESMNQYLKSLAKGVTLIQLNLDDLRKVELIVPPLELQKTYMRFLKQSDKSKFVVSNRNLSRCSVIRRKIQIGIR